MLVYNKQFIIQYSGYKHKSTESWKYPRKVRACLQYKISVKSVKRVMGYLVNKNGQILGYKKFKVEFMPHSGLKQSGIHLQHEGSNCQGSQSLSTSILTDVSKTLPSFIMSVYM
jgi:hypothetical protein